jgi:hypothetical protein
MEDDPVRTRVDKYGQTDMSSLIGADRELYELYLNA